MTHYSQGGRMVAKDTVNGSDVSTVFLGLDHSFGSGPPLWFETMIFGGVHNEQMWQYSTVQEAEAGHAQAVALAQAIDPLTACQYVLPFAEIMAVNYSRPGHDEINWPQVVEVLKRVIDAAGPGT